MKKIVIIFCVVLSGFSFAQQSAYVDFRSGAVKLKVEPDSSYVSGIVVYHFDVLKPIDSIYIDARSLNIHQVFIDNEPVGFKYDENKITIQKSFETSSDNSLLIIYDAKPKATLYFLKRNSEWNIWTQGQGKYTSHWLPSFDDVNEKVRFGFSIDAPKGYTILANGLMILDAENAEFSSRTFEMEHHMSSYLAALVIGKYNMKTETSASGIPLEYYYYPEDSLKVEPTYRYSKQMFDFLEEEIGFSYPWDIYRQVPVHDFLYAGMENTSLTVFSDALMVDSTGFNDKNYINVNAHELAHQWFGNLVTASSSEHHWLQEGFATYYAMLAERDIYGEDFYHFKLYQSAQDLGRQDVAGTGTSLLDPKSSSLTFYQRGAWVLHALRSKVGDAVFRKAVKHYLGHHQFASVETSDFIYEVEMLTEHDLTSFVDEWIVQKEFPFDEAIGLLKEQSVYIQEYIMVDCEAKTSKCVDYLKYYVSDDAKVKVIAQAPELVTKDVFKNSLKVRQAISQYVTKIPGQLKSDYESLLNDKSYLTIESALYNLWINFPLERSKYLVKTQDIVGFSDKNVKLLWLVLHLNTPEFQVDKKQEVLDELLSYTNEKHNAELRINAFKYLDLIKACDAECESNLENAKTHHNWRMVKFAKQLSENQQQNKK